MTWMALDLKTSDKLRWIKLHTLERLGYGFMHFRLIATTTATKMIQKKERNTATAYSRSTIYRLFCKACSDKAGKNLVPHFCWYFFSIYLIWYGNFECRANVPFIRYALFVHFIRLFVSNVPAFFPLLQLAKYVMDWEVDIFRFWKWKISRNHSPTKNNPLPNLVGNFSRFNKITGCNWLFIPKYVLNKMICD